MRIEVSILNQDLIESDLRRQVRIPDLVDFGTILARDSASSGLHRKGRRRSKLLPR